MSTITNLDDYEATFVPSDPNLAPEQEMFAKYPGPYSVLSAGAGSGKTYTIQAKIKWLIENTDLELKNFLALSFTRTAATNLANRYPGIKSMTFDAFSADIFEVAFPAGANLVIAEDIAVRDAIARTNQYGGYDHIDKEIFTKIFKAVDSATPLSKFKPIDINLAIGELTSAIIDHPDEFKDILIRAGVVSFNIRKAFTTANALSTLPKEYQDVSYLIIDEAQDSTQPETVMVLTLAAHNKWRVAIVGDASQNISEWRGVSPDAFMETQHLGGFRNFTLQSNYRSVFPILHAANQLLKFANTNEVAQLQLRTPVPTLPLTDEFKNTIHLYTAVGQQIDMKSQKEAERNGTLLTLFDEHYPTSELPIKTMVEMIKDARAKNESFAVLTRSNVMVDTVAKALNAYGVDMFTKPKTQQASTYRSQTTAILLEHIHSIPQLISNLTNPTVVTTAMKRVMKYTQNYHVNNLIADYTKILNSPSIAKLIQANNAKNAILSVQYMMIRMEAKDNAQRQQLLTTDDINQLAGQDYVVATFHSSKGLEWDNVIIIDETHAKETTRQNSNQNEELRLAYVAITRAKKQLHILQLKSDNAKFKPGAGIYTNTSASVLADPFGHAVVLGLAETIGPNGQSADMLTEMPNVTYVKEDI